MTTTATPSKQTIHGILAQFRDDARNNRDLGDKFERMIRKQYLRLDPLYAAIFSEVWMWNEWPGKGAMGDVGIDLVAQDRATGEYSAIQCKFYCRAHPEQRRHRFLLHRAGKPVSKGLIVCTTDNWGKNARCAEPDQTRHPARHSRPRASPIDWSQVRHPQARQLDRRAKRRSARTSRSALDDVIAGLADADRGKLIMACGTGKTFTALKIAEARQLAGKAHVLFLVPSISLLSQTLHEWTAEAELPLHSLAVCSDVDIGKRRTEGQRRRRRHHHPRPGLPRDDQRQATRRAIRRPDEARRRSDKPPRMTVVFSTYQSIEAVAKAQKSRPAGVRPDHLRRSPPHHRRHPRRRGRIGTSSKSTTPSSSRAPNGCT